MHVKPSLSSLLMALFLLALTPHAGVTQHALIEPPFLRQWTQDTGERTSVIAVRDGLVYYSSPKGIGALDLVTGAPRWQSPTNTDTSISTAVLLGKTIYALQRENKASVLVALDTTPTAPTDTSVTEKRQTRVVARLPADAEYLVAEQSLSLGTTTMSR